MMGDRDNNFQKRKPRKERMEKGIRFHFKEYRRYNKGVVQEICQELQWERCAIRNMREFVGGMGHQVQESSWRAWLVQIDSELLIGKCIGTNTTLLEAVVESFGWFFRLE
jgi:hypothetical protein